MQRNFETSFVTQCAPVLAGLKVANLFRWVEPDASAMHAMAERWAAELEPKGVTVSIIKECPVTHAYLVYVYRAKSLEESLQQPDVQQYLLREGYPQGGLQECLDHLSRCLCCEAEFPHEIGIFLGYPLEDVVGFVANKGKNYTFCGYWKCYGDPAAAQKTFERFRKCTEVYLRCFQSGTPITRLAVAV